MPPESKSPLEKLMGAGASMFRRGFNSSKWYDHHLLLLLVLVTSCCLVLVFSGDDLFLKLCNGSKTEAKLAMARIKLLRNKREVQVRQMRRDIAMLLQSRQEDTARIRVFSSFSFLGSCFSSLELALCSVIFSCSLVTFALVC